MSVPTTFAFNLPLDEIIDQAFSEAFGEEIDGYDLDSAAVKLGLLFQEFQLRGTNLWTMELRALKNPMMIADGGSYTLDGDVVDIVSCFTRDITQSPPGDDLIVARIPAATYDLIPNKGDPGRSYQFYLNRQRAAPVMTLYPVVNVDSTYALYARVVRRLYDVGGISGSGGDADYTANIDAPARWLPAIISGLAWYVGRANRKRLGLEWVDKLEAQFEKVYWATANEDSDGSPTRLEVDASAYFGR